jgi:hypothetical protein
MLRQRFTIAGSMGLVALAAIWMAALRYPCEFAVSAVYTVVVFVLLLACVLAISQPGRRRTVWSSFAVCGGVYLVLSLNPWSRTNRGYSPDPITRPLIELAYEKAMGEQRIHGMLSAPSPEAFWFELFSWDNSQMSTRAISFIIQSFLSLAVATVGGVLSLWLTKGAKDLQPSSPKSSDLSPNNHS